MGSKGWVDSPKLHGCGGLQGTELSIVLGPVCYQPPSLNGDVIARRKKTELTEAGPLHCAAAATTAPMNASTADRHCTSFSYGFRPGKGGRKSGAKYYIRHRKALTDRAEVVLVWE